MVQTKTRRLDAILDGPQTPRYLGCHAGDVGRYPSKEKSCHGRGRRSVVESLRKREGHHDNSLYEKFSLAFISSRLNKLSVKANSVAGEADKLPEEEILAQMKYVFYDISYICH